MKKFYGMLLIVFFSINMNASSIIIDDYEQVQLLNNNEEELVKLLTVYDKVEIVLFESNYIEHIRLPPRIRENVHVIIRHNYHITTNIWLWKDHKLINSRLVNGSYEYVFKNSKWNFVYKEVSPNTIRISDINHIRTLKNNSTELKRLFDIFAHIKIVLSNHNWIGTINLPLNPREDSIVTVIRNSDWSVKVSFDDTIRKLDHNEIIQFTFRNGSWEESEGNQPPVKNTLPIITLDDYQEVTFVAHLSKVLDAKYNIKLQFSINGSFINSNFGNYIQMQGNAQRTKFTYKLKTNVTSLKNYKIAIFENDTKVSPWTSVNYESSKLKLMRHNNLQYKAIISPNSGKIWLDRNIGSKKVCQKYGDNYCIGDYYQWGRNTDGHEKKDSLNSDIQDNPSKFVISHDNWTNLDVNNHWNKTNGSSVCPLGYRVPSIDEMQNEILVNSNDSYPNFLRLPNASKRQYDSGEMATLSGARLYSSSSVHPSRAEIGIFDHGFSTEPIYKANGLNIRCIK